jgi:hypothetical protein
MTKRLFHTLPERNISSQMNSALEDLAKYVSWQLDERDLVVQMSHQLIRGSIRDFGVGLIWDEAIVGGERRLWHSGGAYGMSSQMELFPDARCGIVLLANDGGFDTQSQLDQVAMRIRRVIPHSPTGSSDLPTKGRHCD